MTKSEIEKLIEYIDTSVQKRVFDERYHAGEEMIENSLQVCCRVNDIFDLLDKYPVEHEKAIGPDYEVMYEDCKRTLEEARAHIESLKFDMHHMAVEHAHYAGAVAMIETITGRKFEPIK